MEEAKKQNDKDKRNGVDLTYQDVHDLLQRLGRYTSKLDGLSFRGIFPFGFLIFFFLCLVFWGIRKEQRRKERDLRENSGSQALMGNWVRIVPFFHTGVGVKPFRLRGLPWQGPNAACGEPIRRFSRWSWP
jgi:hypothetical protein